MVCSVLLKNPRSFGAYRDDWAASLSGQETSIAQYSTLRHAVSIFSSLTIQNPPLEGFELIIFSSS